MDLWEIEKELHREGYLSICGIDEAGRGPLAGPVYASAVILPFGTEIKGLNDSKKLTAKIREQLFDEIISVALAYSVATASHQEIDDINILNAAFLAMRRAVETLEPKPDFALVDGNRGPGLTVPLKCIVKGDALSASIAAASILAKVSRDRHMIQMAQLYPQYAFERHKGYPTKLHYEMLREHGPTEIHRRSFIKNI